MADKKLKEYMRDNFDFPTMKKAGIYPKEMKYNDYEGQAAIICRMFDFESVYEYTRQEPIPCHISYAIDYSKPRTIFPYRPFIEVIGGMKPIRPEAKILSFK